MRITGVHAQPHSQTRCPIQMPPSRAAFVKEEEKKSSALKQKLGFRLREMELVEKKTSQPRQKPEEESRVHSQHNGEAEDTDQRPGLLVLLHPIPVI